MPVKAYLRLKQVMETLSEGGSPVINIVGDVLVIPSGEPKTSEYSEHKRWSKIVDGYRDIKTTSNSNFADCPGEYEVRPYPW